MSKGTVYFRGSKQAAREVVRTFVGMLTGKQPDQGSLAAGVFRVIGFAALGSIQRDFLTKARGGTGEDGVKWKPLKPETIAYSRRYGPGEMSRLKKQAGLGRGHNRGIGGNRGVLTKAQETRWWALYRQSLAWCIPRFGFNQEAKAAAASVAWAQLKREGAKTMLEVYGNRQVEILRDTSVLFNSLSPGTLVGGEVPSAYVKPNVEGGAEQVFKEIENGVIVGTTVAYAAKQNKTRPFIPKTVPDKWKREWAETALGSVADAMRQYFGLRGAA
jgi:hypothetical protein